jgi:hypothetical protein
MREVDLILQLYRAYLSEVDFISKMAILSKDAAFLYFSCINRS